MKSHFHLLQLDLHWHDYKFALLHFLSAFVITLLTTPLLIRFIISKRLYDLPSGRKEHSHPVPTMGGVAIFAGMIAAMLLWFPFRNNLPQMSFLFSIIILFTLGIMDDLRDLAARYKLAIQTALGLLVAVAGIRLTSLEGFLGIYELSLSAQYSFTILAVVGITNAFNLIDGIDGLAGGLGFMSLVALGFFLTKAGDSTFAWVAFALAGAILAFLYYNLNPASIFMGDTGSLVLGFVIAFLSIRLLQFNIPASQNFVFYNPVFVLSIVFVPLFDTIRVFTLRIWNGKSPFAADRNHIHHLLTRRGFSHAFAARFICCIHGLLMAEAFLLKNIRQEWFLLIYAGIMLLAILLMKKLPNLYRSKKEGYFPIQNLEKI